MKIFILLQAWFYRHAKVKIADIDDVLKAIDANQDGEISVKELIAIVLDLTAESKG